MSEIQELGLRRLREPFPPEMIGKLPRVTCRDCSDKSNRNRVCDKHSKSKCAECKAYITSAHIHLDFVGHAELTDRLLSVDPLWAWEPFSYDERGLPLISESVEGEKTPGLRLWIRLTVCDVTRPGVGSVEKGSVDIEKQLIGDALRNAAMRFGVALDLWAKGDLATQHAESSDEPPSMSTTRIPKNAGGVGQKLAEAAQTFDVNESVAEGMPTSWRNAMTKRLARKGVVGDDADMLVNFATNRARSIAEVLPEESESVEEAVVSIESGALVVEGGIITTARRATA